MQFFQGRIGRLELIKLHVAYTLFIIGVVYVLDVIGSTASFGSLGLLFILTVFTADAYVRRMHDLGKSGSFCLLIAIPILGYVVALLLLVLKGEDGANRYGLPPN